jgi:hypothetical protein
MGLLVIADGWFAALFRISRFGRSNSRFGRPKFPFSRAPGIRLQIIVFSDVFLPQAGGLPAKSQKIPGSAGITGNWLIAAR